MDDEFAAVHGALCVNLRVLRVCGLAPLTFKRRHTVSIVRVCNALVYYGYFLCTIVNAIIIVGVALDYFVPSEYHDDTKTGLAIGIVSVASILAVMSAAMYGARKRMITLLQLLRQLNKITILTPSESMYVKNKKQTVVVSIVMMVLWCACVVDYVSFIRYLFIFDNPELEYYGSILFGTSIIWQAGVGMLEVHLVLVLIKIRMAVESFNCDLERMLDTLEREGYTDEFAFKMKQCLLRIARFHLILCASIRRVNSQEGRLMLLMIVYFIVQLIANSYWLMVELISIRSRTIDLAGRIMEDGVQVYTIVICTLMIGTLVNQCENTQDEIKKVRVLVSELMFRGRRPGEPYSAAAGVLCGQLLLQQPTFRPLYICALSRSFFLTVITGVITYLVTVLKFYTIEESHKNK